MFVKKNPRQIRYKTLKKRTKPKYDEKRKKLSEEKQLNTPPSTRMEELVQEVMEAISGMMYEDGDWVKEEELMEALKEGEEIKDEEIKKAIECGMSFGLILKYNNEYSLPQKVYRLIEEGKMPDWSAYFEDWPEVKRRKKRKKRKRRAK